ncbi:hypothetical protein [Pedobacter sp. UC225_65]
MVAGGRSIVAGGESMDAGMGYFDKLSMTTIVLRRSTIAVTRGPESFA